ncbi:hypothetical protein BN946_scf184983.g45 [Trametes cinnabarina]|uniref:Uncharacterized protein n=1 Tax=Pycnoporus cinnabarinus TaxID=5643 RepID=A0A060SDG7_PYCCI|nr:hypothetical protein BN946_scf184983.g45 [Trametes cinnabarina]
MLIAILPEIATMHFSAFVKVAIVATQVGMALAVPSALNARQSVPDTCTSAADCTDGDVCFTLAGLLPILGLPGFCVPEGLDPIGLAASAAKKE